MKTTALTKTYALTELVNRYNDERRNAAEIATSQAEVEAMLRGEKQRIEDEILCSHLRGLLVTYPIVHTALWLDVTHIHIRDGKPVAYGATVIEDLSVQTGVQLNNGKLYIQISHEFDDGLVVSETNALPTDKLSQAESLIAAMGADVLTRYQAIVAERTCAELAKQEHCEAEERSRAAKRESAQRLIDTAQDFVLLWDEHRAAARVWAERETERLWRPWTAWAVKTVPDGVTPNEDGEIYTETHLVLDEPAVFRANPATVVRTVNRHGGTIERTVLGCFVSATMESFAAPAIDKKLPYHRHFLCDSYVVNVPPTVSEDPEPAPCAPETTWYQIMRERLSDFDKEFWYWGEELTPEETAKATPEELVDRYGRWLPDGTAE